MEMTTQRSQPTVQATIVTPMQTKWHKREQKKTAIAGWFVDYADLYGSFGGSISSIVLLFNRLIFVCLCTFLCHSKAFMDFFYSIHCYFIAAFYAACSFDISGYFFCLNRFFTFPSRHSDRWFISFVLFHFICHVFGVCAFMCVSESVFRCFI